MSPDSQPQTSKQRFDGDLYALSLRLRTQWIGCPHVADCRTDTSKGIRDSVCPRCHMDEAADVLERLSKSPVETGASVAEIADAVAEHWDSEVSGPKILDDGTHCMGCGKFLHEHAVVWKNMRGRFACPLPPAGDSKRAETTSAHQPPQETPK
jgi:hypothetical protein